MKRGVILLVLAIVFSLPFVSATMFIEGPQKSSFNLGDVIPITGYVQESESVSGYLEFTATCGEKVLPLQIVPVTLNSGQRAFFPSDIQSPEFSASMSMEGTCHITSKLTAGGALIDSADSNTFEVTKELQGSFSIVEPRAQIGSEVAIAGDITRLDGTKVDGSAEIYFSKNDTKYLVNLINFKEGQLSYKYIALAIPEGRYFVDILARDTFGNEKLFKEAISFVLIKQLYTTARLNKDQYLPGETVTVSGEAKTVLQEPVKSAAVSVSLDSKIYSSKITDGKFEGSFQLPYNIQSGKHEVNVVIKDEAGNVGLAKLRLYITPVPSSINIRLNKQEFLPGEMMEITGTLYDQASELMEGKLQLEIKDQNDNAVVSKEISSSNKELFSFNQFEKPGEWTILVTKETLKSEEKVTILEHRDISMVIEDTMLKIINLGNVEFKDDIQISAEGPEGTFTVDKKASLQENETKTIDLSSQLPTGMYAINVKTSDSEKQFSNISILDGKSWHSFNLAYLMLIVVCVGLLAYVSYSKVSPKRSYSQKMPFKVKDVEPKEEKRGFSIYNIGKDKEGEMADFKARILNDIKQTDEADKRRQLRTVYSNPARREAPKKEEKGVFSMFD